MLCLLPPDVVVGAGADAGALEATGARETSMTRCAHANCYCDLDESAAMDGYCSPYCANAGAPAATDPAAESACACQHADCSVAASRENSRDRSSPIAMGGGPVPG